MKLIDDIREEIDRRKIGQVKDVIHIDYVLALCAAAEALNAILDYPEADYYDVGHVGRAVLTRLRELGGEK